MRAQGRTCRTLANDAIGSTVYTCTCDVAMNGRLHRDPQPAVLHRRALHRVHQLGPWCRSRPDLLDYSMRRADIYEDR